jgi:hypothetical protein
MTSAGGSKSSPPFFGRESNPQPRLKAGIKGLNQKQKTDGFPAGKPRPVGGVIF